MTEFDFIEKIRSRAAKRPVGPAGASPTSYQSSLLAGIGDDAAVIKQHSGDDTLVTTDLLVEDIDFRRQQTEPRLLGHKALAVSLSDIAAMGARPRYALVAIAAPLDIWDTTFVDEFYEGLLALADRYDVRLVGGDLSETPGQMVIDSILLGDCANGRAVLRSGAKPGDQLFVTGALGGAAAGLRLLERGARLANETTDSEWPLIKELLLRNLRPEARVGWGLVLGQEALPSAMIDLSDGLSSDLHHLCRESNVGALLQGANLPFDLSVKRLCGRRALDPLMLALHGGEDFELLFAVSPAHVSRLPKKVDGIPITWIGEIKEAAAGVRISEGSREWDLEAGGWEHFRKVRAGTERKKAEG